MTRPVPQIAVDFIKGAEKFEPVGYPDGGGVPTDGWGNTKGAVVGHTVTVEQATSDLFANMGAAAGRLASMVSERAILALDEHEYAALISFVFNVGAEATWTIWKVIDAGQLDQVPAQLKRFDKIRKNGVLVDCPGLDNRRLAEVTLWNTADATAAIAVALAAPVAPPPSSETRAADTPQTPAVVKPLSQSKSFIASIATAGVATVSAAGPVISAAAGGVKQVSDAISPYADAAPMIAHVIHYLAMGSAVLAVVTVALVWLKHKQAVAA